MNGAVVLGVNVKHNNRPANSEPQFSNNSLSYRKGFPLAPEDDEFSQEIRQMVVGRYRVLFTIKGREVHVLHVRGAHPGRIDQLEEDRQITMIPELCYRWTHTH